MAVGVGVLSIGLHTTTSTSLVALVLICPDYFDIINMG